MMESIIQSFDIWTDAQGIKSRTRVKSVDNISLEGIARLREFILDLAMRGRLVPQNQNDEPVSELLKKIQEEKEQLVKEGKIKKLDQISIIKTHEQPYEIPRGWVFVRNSDLFSMRKGKKPQTLSEEAIGLPYLDIDALDRNNYKKYTTDPNCILATDDDILLVCDGSRSGLVLNGKNGVVGSTLAVIDSAPSIKPFLRLLFEKSFRHLNSTMKGAAIPHLDSKNLLESLTAVPPQNEQNRIISKVDELMALCDKLEEQQFNNLKTHQELVKTLLETLTQAVDANELQIAWERMSTLFDTLFCTEDAVDQLKQTILQLAVMGKLVKQDPNDVPASELLKQIEEEKENLVNEKKIKKQKPLLKIAEDAKPFDLPRSWIWVPWGSILGYDDYPFKRGPFGSSLKKDMFIESGYKVYEQYCPINDDCSYERYYISDELYKKLEGFAVKEDDYLVSCSGATLGRITQVPKNFKEGIINQALLRVRMNHKYIDKIFFKLLFRSPYFQKMIFDNSTGSAIPNVKGVNKLKVMPVPFLPLVEQQRIVKKIEELYTICDNLKVRIVKSQKIKGLLSKNIVEKAAW